jgi:hypothetical protein
MRTPRSISFTLFVLLVLGAASVTHTSAQEAAAPRSLTVDDYFALKDVNSPRISPDGAWVVYAAGSQDLENDRSETQLWRVPTSGGEGSP